MNTLEEAAKVLENNWCTGYLFNEDKFCSIGAIVAVEENLVTAILDTEALEERFAMEGEIYQKARESKAVKALAEEIIDQTSNHDIRDEYMNMFGNGKFDDVVIDFNDTQDDVEPVLEMFRHAAKRLDS